MLGIRAFDFDVYYDPDGCLYAHHGIRTLLGKNPDQSNDANCKASGYKVLGVPVRLF